MGIDKLFAPGLIYIMSGEPWDGAEPIYKIGATTQDPKARARQIQETMRFMSVRVVHSFPVDNMRVVESLLHFEFSDRCLDTLYTREWFDIDEEAYYLTQCAGLYVNDCLAELSTGDDIYEWWRGLKGIHLFVAKYTIWKHPSLRIELEQWAKLEQAGSTKPAWEIVSMYDCNDKPITSETAE